MIRVGGLGIASIQIDVMKHTGYVWLVIIIEGRLITPEKPSNVYTMIDNTRARDIAQHAIRDTTTFKSLPTGASLTSLNYIMQTGNRSHVSCQGDLRNSAKKLTTFILNLWLIPTTDPC